jgi:hypothetical protein
MKYPLAITKRLLDLYGEDAGLGYDIMCAFYKTLLRSSLGRRVVSLRLRGVVPAFHGHAHNRGCQIGWLPLYVEGVGLEDFEECERTFCLSNNLAAVTRLSTPFHRQQQIDEHFNFHDLDKHAASGKFHSSHVLSLISPSGNFIFQNYRQATEKIAMNTVNLDILEQRLHTTAEDYEAYLVQERKHLESLKREPSEVVWTVEYTELLQKYEITEYVFLLNHFYCINDPFLEKRPSPLHKTSKTSTITSLTVAGLQTKSRTSERSTAPHTAGPSAPRRSSRVLRKNTASRYDGRLHRRIIRTHWS